MKTLMRIVTLLSLGVLGSTANADPITVLTVDGDYFLGSITPGTAPSDEPDFINDLILLAAGDGPVVCANTSPAPGNKIRYCDRTGSTVAGPFPTATGAYKVDTSDNTGIDATGYAYILGKYGTDALVWFIDGDLGMVDIPASWTASIPNCEGPTAQCTYGGGLSHYTLLNFDGDMEVPEPGTIGLLGLGLLGLGLRRRNKA